MNTLRVSVRARDMSKIFFEKKFRARNEADERATTRRQLAQQPQLSVACRMLDGMIDHVAIAVHDMRASIPFYTDALGARFLFAGENLEQGFRWAQFRFPDGGKIELVTPLTRDGFVARFLERRGEGVHHVTMKVNDIEGSIEHLRARGIPLFNVRIDREDWREAFIHPRDANGTLFQIAQSKLPDDELARHHLQPHEAADHRHVGLKELLSESPGKPGTS